LDRIGEILSQGPIAPAQDTMVLLGNLLLSSLICWVDGAESPLNTSPGGPVIQGLMGPLVVVEVEVIAEADFGFPSA